MMSDYETRACPICRTESTASRVRGRPAVFYACNSCGLFQLYDDALATLGGITGVQRAVLSTHIRMHQVDDERVLIALSTLLNITEASEAEDPVAKIVESSLVPVDAPKVFVSHATEDQVRFVTNFVAELRKNGVDAWYSKWELKAGDRLVQKIAQGIESCEAFIVVLSPVSVDKPWVAEELDAGLIRSINEKTRLIPVVLDDARVPLLLRSRVWVTIDDVSDFTKQIDAIIDALFDRPNRLRPAVGSPPKYTSAPVSEIFGLRANDVSVLAAACELVMNGTKDSTTPEEIRAHQRLEGMASATLLTSLEVMESTYFKFLKVMNPKWNGIFTVTPTRYGFERYAAAFIPDYDLLKKQMAAKLVQMQQASSNEFAQEFGISETIVEHFFQVLEDRGMLRTMQSTGRTTHVYRINAGKLTRAIEDGDF